MHTHARHSTCVEAREQPCELGSPPLSVSGVQVVRLAPQMLSQLSHLLEPRHLKQDDRGTLTLFKRHRHAYDHI